MAVKRAVIYTRISRDDTGEGAANERQEEDCRKLCDLRGWEIVAAEADISVSASTGKKRPAWERVLGMVDQGDVDVVVAWHMDRMTRSMLDLEKLIVLAEQQNVGIATVSGDIDLTSDMGRMVARILAAVARAEVERKSARQRRANEQRAAQGIPWRTGFRAFGYTLNGEVVEQEAALIQKAAEEVLQGTPLRAIVRHWKDLKIPTARSRKNTDGWTHNSVRSILLNPRNAGIATYKGETIGRGRWEAILSEETHALLVATLTDSSRRMGDKTLGNKPRNLLSGIATCGVCGSTVEAGSSSGRKVYKCSNPSGDHLTTDRAEAEDVVRKSLVAAAPTFGAAITATLEPREEPIPAELWEERRQANERLNKLAVSWADGVLTDPMFEAASASLKTRLAGINERIETAVADESRGHNDGLLDNVFGFMELDMYRQRDVLKGLVAVTLWPRNRKRNVSIAQQVTVHLNLADGTSVPVLDQRTSQPVDPSAAAYSALADLLVATQPEGITTLAKAATWLVDNDHTSHSPSGIPGRLSPLVRYARDTTGSSTGWTHKN